MTGTIFISGVIGEDVNLLDVIRQVKAQKQSTEYLVKIDSVGGNVNVGMDIYNYLKNLDKPITTYANRAYSIASAIFLAGSERIIEEDSTKALMIHLPWGKAIGNAQQILAYQQGLQKIENELIEFYSQALQEEPSTIQSLLQKDTYINADEALSMGFATKIQAAAKAVAMINNEKEENESLMNKLESKISAIYNKLFPVKAELVLQDATGTSQVFPELSEGDIPSVGDKVNVDGKPAEGDYLQPDGSTITYEKGLVIEITPAEVEEPVEEAVAAEDEEVTEDAPEVDKDARIAELEAKVAELEAKIAELEGSEQAKAEEETDETESKVADIMAKMLEKNEELEARYTALAKMVGSDYQPEKKENTPAVKATEGEKPKFSIKRK